MRYPCRVQHLGIRALILGREVIDRLTPPPRGHPFVIVEGVWVRAWGVGLRDLNIYRRRVKGSDELPLGRRFRVLIIYTLQPEPQRTEPRTPNPTPQTQNTKRQTQNPKPHTPNLKFQPQTQTQTYRRRQRTGGCSRSSAPPGRHTLPPSRSVFISLSIHISIYIYMYTYIYMYVNIYTFVKM